MPSRLSVRTVRLLPYLVAVACFALAAAAPYVLPAEARLIAAATFMVAGVIVLVSAAAGYWPRRG